MAYIYAVIYKYWRKSIWKIPPLITHVSNWTVSKVNKKKSHWNCFSFSWSHWEEKGFSSMVFWNSVIIQPWGNLLKQLPLMRKPFHLAHPAQTQTTSSDWERGRRTPFHGKENSALYKASPWPTQGLKCVLRQRLFGGWGRVGGVDGLLGLFLKLKT